MIDAAAGIDCRRSFVRIEKMKTRNYDVVVVLVL